MWKIWDWMHGKGRPVVIMVVCVLALWIIVDYYRETHPEQARSDGPAIISEPEEGSGESAGVIGGGADDMPEEADDGEDISTTREETDDGEDISTTREGSDGGEDISTTREEIDDGEDISTTREGSDDGEDISTTQEEVGGTEAFQNEQKSGKDVHGKMSSGETVTLGFAGDINFDESWVVMRHLRAKGKGISGCIDKKLISRMRQEDAMILNNEFAFSNRGTPMKGKAFTFCSPTKNVKMLGQMGVDAVSLANNHIYDYGKDAFLDTVATLRKAGIKTTGGGKKSKEAKKPVYLHIKGKTIAVIAATRAEKYILTPEAGKSTPGVFRTYNDAEYVKAIKKAKKKADYVIPFVHWGTEYSTKLESAQITQARDYINAGADMVVGAHTHCLQGAGYYKGKPIFYSLGNYWFNEKTLYTTLLQVNIDENGKLEAYMLPCLQKGCETKLLTKKKSIRKFNQYVNRISPNAHIGAKGRVRQK